MTDVWIAFGLTLFAGMATGIGSIIAFTAKRTNYRFLSVATGFSGGVMLYVSFVEILFKGADALAGQAQGPNGQWLVGRFLRAEPGEALLDLLDGAQDDRLAAAHRVAHGRRVP